MTISLPWPKNRYGRWLKNISQSFLYNAVRSRGQVTPFRSVVFVCKGNVCRSAYAEYFFKSAMKGGMVRIHSCGLDVQVRSSAPGAALSVARLKGLNLDDHLSKGVAYCDFDNADLILAMEFWQYRMLVRLFPHKKSSIRLLRDFAPFPENLLCNIDDPFGKDVTEFERCFQQIERSLRNLMAQFPEKNITRATRMVI